MILESSHQAVCDALHRAIIERDQLKADIAAVRAEDARLRREIREAVRVESTLAASESVTLARVLSILRAALDATPETRRGHVDGDGDDPGNRREG